MPAEGSFRQSHSPHPEVVSIRSFTQLCFLHSSEWIGILQIAVYVTAEGVDLSEVVKVMRKRFWMWIGVGEAISAVLAAALAYSINILTAEKQVHLTIFVGVVGLAVFSAAFAWARRAGEAKKSADEQRSAATSKRGPLAPGITLSGKIKDSRVVLSSGGPVAILNRVQSDSISVVLGSDGVRSATDSTVAGAIFGRLGRRQVDGSGLASVADQLAASIGNQWKDEANWRHLNDPYAMPVRWAPANPCLSVSWPTLVKLAAEGPGWSAARSFATSTPACTPTPSSSKAFSPANASK